MKASVCRREYSIAREFNASEIFVYEADAGPRIMAPETRAFAF